MGRFISKFKVKTMIKSEVNSKELGASHKTNVRRPGEFLRRKLSAFAASFNRQRAKERGVALISVLLIMSLMLMLGLAVTFTSMSDQAITQNFKNVTSGFYAAEAGVNSLHRLIRSEKFVISSLPDPPVVTVGEPSLNANDFTAAAERILTTRESFPNQSAYR